MATSYVAIFEPRLIATTNVSIVKARHAARMKAFGKPDDRGVPSNTDTSVRQVLVTQKGGHRGAVFV